jgi:hypothetical protein
MQGPVRGALIALASVAGCAFTVDLPSGEVIGAAVGADIPIPPAGE